MNEVVNNSFDEVINQFEKLFLWVCDHGFRNNDTHCSENITEITGYESDEIMQTDKGWEALILKDDLPDYRKEIHLFSEDVSRNFFETEYRIIRKDGSIIWLNEKIKVFRNDEGKITRSAGFISDLTSVKSELKKLKKNVENLEQLNSSKDNFISILSHDLRAPFTSILGFSEILMNETGLPLKEKAEYLKYINDSSQNQLQLINYLLDWSRLQTGRLKIEQQRIHAQSLVYNCVSLLTGMAVRKNINIKVNIPDMIYLDADERLITQVITNLISNGIKFSRENDSVEISAGIYNNDFVEFIVKDEGIGIAETYKERIFNIGRIFSTEGTKGEKGSGLGLALAKQIVEKHNGDIWFYSDEGLGCEFHFTVPSSANTILIVRSKNDDQKELEKLFDKQYFSFNIHFAENGFEALGIISAKMPSLIIADDDLPLMDGMQLINTVKKEYKNLRIPFIILLKEENSDKKESYREIGVKTLTCHPLKPDKLKEKVLSLLV